MKFSDKSLATRVAYFLDTCARHDGAIDALPTFGVVCAFLDAQCGARWHGVAL